MPDRPSAFAFDVIGTLFALEPLGVPRGAFGLPPGTLGAWFARILRDGFALVATGAFRPFAEVASGRSEGCWRSTASRPPPTASRASWTTSPACPPGRTPARRWPGCSTACA
nr:hypothetical protein [Tautonia plasticadhaerens]